MPWQLYFSLDYCYFLFYNNSSSCESGNTNLGLGFRVSIRYSFSQFSIISRIILSLVTFLHLVKWFSRFPSLKFWISFFRIGTIFCWNFEIGVCTYLIANQFLCKTWRHGEKNQVFLYIIYLVINVFLQFWSLKLRTSSTTDFVFVS